MMLPHAAARVLKGGAGCRLQCRPAAVRALRGVHSWGRVHDVASGASALPAFQREDRVYAVWEVRMHALVVLLVTKKHLSVDELRRGIEALPAELQNNLSYYEKWAASVVGGRCGHLPPARSLSWHHPRVGREHAMHWRGGAAPQSDGAAHR